MKCSPRKIRSCLLYSLVLWFIVGAYYVRQFSQTLEEKGFIEDLGYRRKKFVEYGTQGGWSNQLACLEHAIWIAKALDRILVLPPVLPHHGPKASDHATFKKKTLGDLYTIQDPYVRLDKILNVSYFGVEVVDYRDLHHNATQYTDYIANRFHHRNTKWILNQPELEGLKTIVKTREYGKLRIYQQIHLDIKKTFSKTSHDIISFYSVFKENGFHPSLWSSSNFRLRYTKPIQNTAVSIVSTLGDFISVHIRAGDGIFKKNFRKKNFIAFILNNIQPMLKKYIETQPVFPSGKEIVLYVATDKKNIEKDNQWIRSYQILVNMLPKNWKLQVSQISNYQGHIAQLTKLLQLDATPYLDQLIASCATIGFSGMEGIPGVLNSSFTGIIKRLRKENPCKRDFKS